MKIVKGLERHAELGFHSAGNGVSKSSKQGHGSSSVSEMFGGGEGRKSRHINEGKNPQAEEP